MHHPVANFEFYQNVRQECEIDAINENRSDSQIMGICNGEPNTALLTTCIMISTFALAYGLRQLRQSYYLGRTVYHFFPIIFIKKYRILFILRFNVYFIV